MANKILFVSAIIPCRNEEKFIKKCLDSIIANDYSKDRFEILVIDGMSEDNTKKIVQDYIGRYPYVKLLENHKKITPVALNIGIKEAKGEIIMKIDAHSVYEKDYISKCVRYLTDYDADNVGGVLKTLPRDNTLVAKAISFCLSSPFGAGTSYFRIGSKEPRWVDTVAFGCYRKEIFNKIGLFDERMSRSQDIELNLRLKKAGGKILLVPSIIAYYYPASTFKSFLKHYFIDGAWVTYPLRLGLRVFSWRHLIPLVFVSSLIGLVVLSFFFSMFLRLFLFAIGLYFLANIYYSLKIVRREKDFRYLFLMPIIFSGRHISYGLGSVWGLIKLSFK